MSYGSLVETWILMWLKSRWDARKCTAEQLSVCRCKAEDDSVV